MFTMFALFGVYSKKVLKCVGTASFIKPQSSEGLRLQKENILYAHKNSYSLTVHAVWFALHTCRAFKIQKVMVWFILCFAERMSTNNREGPYSSKLHAIKSNHRLSIHTVVFPRSVNIHLFNVELPLQMNCLVCLNGTLVRLPICPVVQAAEDTAIKDRPHNNDNYNYNY